MKRLLIILPFLCIGIVGKAQVSEGKLDTLIKVEYILAHSQVMMDTSNLYDSALRIVQFQYRTKKEKNHFLPHTTSEAIINLLHFKRDEYFLKAMLEVKQANSLLGYN